MLRAHGLIHKLPHTHRYRVSEQGRRILNAILRPVPWNTGVPPRTPGELTITASGALIAVSFCYPERDPARKSQSPAVRWLAKKPVFHGCA